MIGPGKRLRRFRKVSSVIARHAYDADAHALEITFVSGRSYLYTDVPPAIAAALDRAGSQGAYFNERIRDRFPYVRVPHRLASTA